MWCKANWIVLAATILLSLGNESKSNNVDLAPYDQTAITDIFNTPFQSFSGYVNNHGMPDPTFLVNRSSNSPASNIQVALMTFDLSYIPVGATINSVWLSYKLDSSSPTGVQVILTGGSGDTGMFSGSTYLNLANPFVLNPHNPPLTPSSLPYQSDVTNLVTDAFTQGHQYAFVQFSATAGEWYRIAGNRPDYFQSYQLPRIHVDYTPVPEPSTLSLLAIGFISSIAFTWRQRRAV
jgi:hypothetical protein